MQKFEKANFNIQDYKETENYGKFVIEPLERGFGTTIGNALRRVLLSSLPGAAIHAVKINGAIHEFSAVDGVVEDVTKIILQLKKLVFKIDHDETVTMTIDVEGPATVTGADIQCSSDVTIISKDLEIQINNMNEVLTAYIKHDKEVKQTLFGCHVVVDEKARHSYYSVGVMSKV